MILVSKVKNAELDTESKPISCVNILYKVISKLLIKRLQEILVQVISPFHSAFIKGRLLAENVLFTIEMVHGYNMRNITKREMLKVDLRKVFNSIRWDFILSNL